MQTVNPSWPIHQNKQPPIPTSLKMQNSQRYLYANPGRSAQINPVYVQRNENYYQLPIVQKLPITDSLPNYAPYSPSSYYNYFQYPYRYGCFGCQGSYYPQPCAPCYSESGLPNYMPQTINCYQSGLSANRNSLTSKFPKKLPHSYVTSGQRAQDKLIIKEPIVESAPFQAQRRKSYVPYTRKYIEYQDYIQYIPVQKSLWKYQKVMKQIDFVPQQYYESSIEMIPRQSVNYRLRYVPVKHQIVHVPQQISMAKANSNQLRRIEQDKKAIFSQHSQIGIFNPPLNQGVGLINPGFSSLPKGSQVQTVRSSDFNNKSYLQRIEQNQSYKFVKPQEAKFTMNQNAQIESKVNSIAQQHSPFVSQNNINQYQFSGEGVLIGSSQQAQFYNENSMIIESQQRFQIQQNKNPKVEISKTNRRTQQQQSALQHHLEAKRDTDANRKLSYINNFRESKRFDSEEINFDTTEYKKRESIVNKFYQV